MSDLYDIAVVGGGVNGCGVARDAAGRGLKVFLCEQGDLAGGTSSNTSKLIHGGLRYLEYYEFRLVREALKEREALWAIAPHIVWPMRFVLPHHKGLRPAWLLRLGLFLYDHLGGRKLLPPTRTLDLARDPLGAPLKRGAFALGFEYSDCWVEDSRLVAFMARDAADRGAHGAHPRKGGDGDAGRGRLDGGPQTRRRCRFAPQSLVDAAGPWVSGHSSPPPVASTPAKVRLVQGSHIVVRRLYDHDRCYFFQNADGRILLRHALRARFHADRHDRRRLSRRSRRSRRDRSRRSTIFARAPNAYLAKPVTPADVVWKFAGVRPLYDDGASAAEAATRDYVLDLDDEGGAPLLVVYGGKVTTHRPLAEHVLEKLGPHLPPEVAARRGWTRASPLPGGDFPFLGFETLVNDLSRRYPWLDPVQSRRLARAYGTNARVLLGEAKRPADLGRAFGAGLTQAEIDYLMRREWALEAADVVWRRSKLGLRLTADEIAAIDAYMAQRAQNLATNET